MGKYIDINGIVNRAKMIGCTTEDKGDYIKIPIPYNNQIYVVVKDGVQKLSYLDLGCGKNIKVAGGNDLKTTREMFRDYDAEVIDLSDFNTSNVIAFLKKSRDVLFIMLRNINLKIL